MKTSRKFSQSYKALALHLLNTLVFLILVNIGLLGVFAIKNYFSSSNSLVQLLREHSNPNLPNLKKIYPDLSEQAIFALLKETWSRPYSYEAFTQFKERPYRGDYVNVDKNGFRITKNQGPWPPEPDKLNIFLFGGSTTFGYGVPDDQTVASYLQQFLSDKLGREVRVYNFGRGFYYSTQERILLEKLLASGFLPKLAVFLDGYNDFFHPSSDEPVFTNELESFINGKEKILLLNNLPLTRFIVYLKERVSTTLEKKQEHLSSEDKTYNNEPIINYVVNRYLTNKKLIEAVTAIYGVRSVFVWQPVPTYKYDVNYHLFAGNGFGIHPYSRYGYRYMEELIKKKPLGDNFLWCADIQEHLKEPLYVDQVHYSAKLSKLLAATMADLLLERNFL